MRFITGILLIVFGISVSFSQADTAKLQFVFVGDIMQHGGQIAGAYNVKKDTYDYRDCFQFVKPIIQKGDISIANLEVTHAGKPYKGYPQFSAPPELSESLVDAGFNVIITANNHSCDGGSTGVVKTLDVLDHLGVKHTGTFRNKEERDKNYPLIVEKNGLKVVILNYTYGTNGLSVAKPLIINYIDSAVMLADFVKAREMNPDLIVCALHWGTEYQSLPNAYQKSWEKFCYDQGADMVIGSHPHVLQPVDVKEIKGEKKLTAWSLGNFVSNQRDRYKDGGMILMAEVKKASGKTVLGKVEQVFTWVYPRQEAVVKPFYILPEFNYADYRADFFDPESKDKYDLFFADSRSLFKDHSKGTTEFLVTGDKAVVGYYKKLLKGYYALEYPEQVYSSAEIIKPAFKPLIHKILGADGSYHWVLGYFEKEADAREIAHEAMIAEPKYVFISPTIYKLIP
ncbi:CapA family protein [Fluviicola sp.]|jgi:poly-gamma-glutamate synthesis protein (capsule biosynthesis protein)|uniref:CapA family protein n=1 Tax=Fluviicola sp. TaxID=1917219 RepID=UPI0028289236|nr:CapA family protein [Fluviicola sp.]MDR0803265.1 CapA family protein [Fluviicola sp.]